MTFLSFLISGISLGSIYAIIALGYTMVYGIAKMLNFAHGDVIMVGAYICFYATSRLELPAVVGVMTTISYDGLTGQGMTWSADGTVSKAPRAVVIENGVYVLPQ